MAKKTPKKQVPPQCIYTDTVITAMVRVGLNDAGVPVFMRLGEDPYQVPTEAEVQWIEGYARALVMKARDLRAWVKLARRKRA